jgi:lipid-binding SYLF domain-containing protein
MFRNVKMMVAAGLAAVVLGASAAEAQQEQQNLVDQARITIDHLKKDREFGNAEQLLRHARGVMIVPALVKGGFFVGGEGGDALLLTRNGPNSWSDPAFYTLASASFGLQIGLEQSEMVLFVMNQKALDAFMQDEFKIGAQAGLAIVTLGSSAEADTTAALNADIVVWSSSTGAYAGLTLNGSLIKPRDSFNAAYYGHAANPVDIVIKDSVKNAGDSGLRHALGSLS